METVSILIPAYNEEKSIRECILSCINQTKKLDEIIVVNDGSKDRTLKILKSFGTKIKIINLKKNTGNKSKAQEIGLKHVKTSLFITTDADTKLDVNFVKEITRNFKNKEISAVCGLVESEDKNWITRIREIDYLVGQTIYKNAQSILNAVLILAGCGSAFRTKDFIETVHFDHDNVTEDLDFTYQLKIADKKILYEPKAIVYTKDPDNVRSYLKQIYRWYSGGWTCLKKNIKIIKQPNNALILLMIYPEELIMGTLFLFSPLLLLSGLGDFLYLFLAEFILLSLCLSYGAIKYKRHNLFFYIPHHYLMHILDNVIFLFTFSEVIFFNKVNLIWQRSKRY